MECSVFEDLLLALILLTTPAVSDQQSRIIACILVSKYENNSLEHTMSDLPTCLNETLGACFYYDTAQMCGFEGDSDIVGNAHSTTQTFVSSR